MFEIKSRLKGVTDTGQWAAHGASFVAKVKATKAVWFPPQPVETGKKAVSTARSATTSATRKTTGTAKKTSPAAKKTTGAAKKTASTARRKKT